MRVPHSSTCETSDAKLLEQNIQADPEDYEENQYYADYRKFMIRFLPVAHKLQVPESD